MATIIILSAVIFVSSCLASLAWVLIVLSWLGLLERKVRGQGCRK